MKSVDLWADNNNAAVISKNNKTSTTNDNEKFSTTTTKQQLSEYPETHNNKEGKTSEKNYSFQDGEVNAAFEMPVRDSSFHGMDLQHSMQHRQRGSSIKKERLEYE